jgi:hypothetical protein
MFFLPKMLVAIAVNSPVFMAMPIGKYRRRQDFVYMHIQAIIRQR